MGFLSAKRFNFKLYKKQEDSQVFLFLCFYSPAFIFYCVFVVISDQTGSSGAVNSRFLKRDGVTP